jgi:hypothetical protein
VAASLHFAHITTCCRSFPCSKCKRTFTSSRGVPDLTLTSGIDPGVYKSESFAGQDIFRCQALLPYASACWHLADLLSPCLFLLGDYACLQLIAVLYEFAGIPLSASFMSVAGGKGSSQLGFQVITVHCNHESINSIPFKPVRLWRTVCIQLVSTCLQHACRLWVYAGTSLQPLILCRSR